MTAQICRAGVSSQAAAGDPRPAKAGRTGGGTGDGDGDG